MASVNKVILLGNLGRDPESRTFPSGDMVTNIAIATTDKWKDKQSGEQMEATEWHRVQFNGRLAEIANEFLRKGDPVYVEGSIRSRKYNDKDGVERTVTEIRADRMQLLGGRRDGGGQEQAPQRQQSRAPAPQQRSTGGRNSGSANNYGSTRGEQRGGGPSGFDDMDDSIPF